MRIMNEHETMAVATQGRNLSRFGDGELRLAIGGKASSQKADPRLAMELKQILAGDTRAIACIPPTINPRTLEDCPRREFWKKYNAPEFLSLYGSQNFGSSFVSRPDSAPWIDDDLYWHVMVAGLWTGRDVLYVTGGDKHLEPVINRSASSYVRVTVPERDAYDSVDEIEQEIIGLCRPETIVLLACGAAATVLAHRLARHKIHAVDIGHTGMFWDVQGAYAMKPEDLATQYYRDQLVEAHRVKKWGGGGYSWAEAARDFRKKINAKSILDYGCGQGTFKKRMAEIDPKTSVVEYDPGIVGKQAPPKPADMVVCTDVMEHVELKLIDNVLKHIYTIGRKGAFFVIAKGPANKQLPDGRNAHLVQEGLWFWKARIEAACNYEVVEFEDTRKHVLLWAQK